MGLTKKGIIIWDERADDDLLPHVRKSKWKVKTITPFDKSVSLKDPQVTKKYTKGIYPIFTGDHTIIDDDDQNSGATG